MNVSELIEQLQTIDGESRVFLGYDGNIVVTEAGSVDFITKESQIGYCWARIQIGDTVILCKK